MCTNHSIAYTIIIKSNAQTWSVNVPRKGSSPSIPFKSIEWASRCTFCCCCPLWRGLFCIHNKIENDVCNKTKCKSIRKLSIFIELKHIVWSAQYRSYRSHSIHFDSLLFQFLFVDVYFTTCFLPFSLCLCFFLYLFVDIFGHFVHIFLCLFIALRFFILRMWSVLLFLVWRYCSIWKMHNFKFRIEKAYFIPIETEQKKKQRRTERVCYRFVGAFRSVWLIPVTLRWFCCIKNLHGFGLHFFSVSSTKTNQNKELENLQIDSNHKHTTFRELLMLF